MNQLFFLFLTVFLITGSAQADTFEPTTSTVPVTDILNRELIKGDLYTISESVTVDGYMNHFQIESDFGPFTEIGDHELKKNIT